MGITIPGEWPEIDPIKYYYCVGEHWHNTVSDDGCSGEQVANSGCCVIGTIANAWTSGGFDCTLQNDPCFLGVPDNFKLISIDGPYDTGLCQDEP